MSIPVTIVLDTKTREVFIFPRSDDELNEAAVDHIGNIVAKSQRARTEIRDGGLPPRQSSEFYITDATIGG